MQFGTNSATSLFFSLGNDSVCKLHKLFCATRATNKGIGKQFRCRGPLVRLHLILPPFPHVRVQSTRQKRLEHFTPILRMLHRRRRTGVNQQQRLQRRVVVVRRLAVRHLQRSDAQRPDVHLAGIADSLDKFRSHPEGRAHHRLAPLVLRVKEWRNAHGRSEPHGKTEIGQFYFALAVQQDVV